MQDFQQESLKKNFLKRELEKLLRKFMKNFLQESLESFWRNLQGIKKNGENPGAISKEAFGEICKKFLRGISRTTHGRYFKIILRKKKEIPCGIS